MAEKQKRNQFKNSSWFSNQKIWENTDPVTTLATAFNGTNKIGEKDDENDDMKGTKRKILVVNVVAILICTGLLINRALMCLERCHILFPFRAFIIKDIVEDISVIT